MDKLILILDDEQEYIVALKKILDEFLYKVEVTLYPHHALEIIKEHKPTLVLFDYKMPEMDGDQFFEKAKKISPLTTYVLITAYRDDATVERFKKLGVNEVLMKPLDLENLLTLIPKD